MSNAEKQEWEYLLRKFISGSIRQDKVDNLLQLTEENSSESFNDIMLLLWNETGSSKNSRKSADMEKFDSMIKEAEIYTGKKQEQQKSRSWRYWYIAAAAISGIMLAISLFFYHSAKEDTSHNNIAGKNEAPLDFSRVNPALY